MWCVADDHNDMCYICAKGFLDPIFNEAVIDKMIKFSRIAPNFKYSKIVFFKKYN